MLFVITAVVLLGLLPILNFAVIRGSIEFGKPAVINPFLNVGLFVSSEIIVILAIGGWFVGIISWYIRRRWWRAIIQTAVLPCSVVVLYLLIICDSFFLMMVSPPYLYDQVYSHRHGKYYFLASKPAPNATCYQVLGTSKLWMPVWTQEFWYGLESYGVGLMTESVGLILSRDESLLVIWRGWEKTDAIDLESGMVLTRGNTWTAAERMQQQAARTAQIDNLLAAAAEK